ncbi:venom protease-like [Teleopsis dalmanni]|uniref:venom protease-like n=1 Tax=Teleopsis dalmanni TaxID=139649 RepID=UPI0018CC8F31|nr:venom protease-like [Teleopsis dalmanni]XP_037933439.1 venom protease-like [Teleopsis dalmanni]
MLANASNLLKSLTLILIFVQINSTIGAEEECGLLDPTFYALSKNVAHINEFPWVGRIAYKSETDPKNTTYYACIAVLISKSHMLSRARCFIDKTLMPNLVILGDWDIANSVTKRDCMHKNSSCNEVPQQYSIMEVALHPRFQNRTGNNDIVVLTLATEVNITEFVRPICLPPEEWSPNDHLAQYLRYVGYQNSKKNSKMLKTMGMVISMRTCQNNMGGWLPYINDTNICLSRAQSHNLISGSPVMGVTIKDGEPHNYYLIGLLDSKILAYISYYDIFIRVAPYLDFIKTNMNKSCD